MSFKIKLAAACAVAGLGFTACSGSGTNPVTPTQDKIATDILTFSVGTANIYGDVAADKLTGLNFAAAYRQPPKGLHPGDSAVLVSSPTITLPFALSGAAGSAIGSDATSTVITGFAPGEGGGEQITSTPQTSSVVTSFGVSGGVFQTGIEPFNYGEGGTPDSTTPYPVPLFDAAAPMDPNQNTPWGGPPAFDLLGDGTSPVGSPSTVAGVSGVSEGLDVFAGLSPVVGNYTLSVSVPANTGTSTVSASASLHSATLLPAITPPSVATDGSGGASFTVTFPAGVTEAYVQIIDIGPAATPATMSNPTPAANVSCNGSDAAPVYYTVEVTPSSPTGTLGDAAGPGGTPSICTAAQDAKANAGNGNSGIGGDQVVVQTYGFDYPLYENTMRNSSVVSSPSPTLTGSNGQSDVTISSAGEFVSSSIASHPQVTRSHIVVLRHSRFAKGAFRSI